MIAEEIDFESKFQKTKTKVLSFSKELALISTLCICLGIAHIYTYVIYYERELDRPSFHNYIDYVLYNASRNQQKPAFPIVIGLSLIHI